MNALAITEPVSLPSLVRNAARKLAEAETSAEVLDARQAASFAYDAAKLQGRIAKAKQAHDEVVAATMHAQADALEIESMAKRRLADEYDAAQDRGEVQKPGGARNFNIPVRNNEPPAPTVAEIGLTAKEIHDARQVRDAERADPGIVRRTLDNLIASGEEPTRAAVKREIAVKQEPRVSDDALWLWGRLCDFDRRGYFDASLEALFAGMTAPMLADVRRLTPLVRNFLEDLECALEPA